MTDRLPMSKASMTKAPASSSTKAQVYRVVGSRCSRAGRSSDWRVIAGIRSPPTSFRGVLAVTGQDACRAGFPTTGRLLELYQTFQQCSCRFEIGGRKPFGKPVVDR